MGGARESPVTHLRPLPTKGVASLMRPEGYRSGSSQSRPERGVDGPAKRPTLLLVWRHLDRQEQIPFMFDASACRLKSRIEGRVALPMQQSRISVMCGNRGWTVRSRDAMEKTPSVSIARLCLLFLDLRPNLSGVP